MSQTDEWEQDDWPQIQKEIDATDIWVRCTSAWLGEKSSVCNRVLERMYGNQPDVWDAGCKTDFKNPEHKR